ncbi:type II secretion system protein [bacterium]|nr:type II secretion system protein [bacterium]
MKKSFTLSEALITLAIIGVLAAILIPVINNVRPDKDKVAYKKAIYTLQSAVTNAMDATEYSMAANSAAYWLDPHLNGYEFCEAIADSLNIRGSAHCRPEQLPAGGSTYDSPNFITTDGIRYWNLENAFRNGNKYNEIYVDRNLTTGEINNIAAKRNKLGEDGYGLKIRVRYDGKFDTPDTAAYEYENEMMEQSLQVTQGKR